MVSFCWRARLESATHIARALTIAQRPAIRASRPRPAVPRARVQVVSQRRVLIAEVAVPNEQHRVSGQAAACRGDVLRKVEAVAPRVATTAHALVLEAACRAGDPGAGLRRLVWQVCIAAAVGLDRRRAIRAGDPRIQEVLALDVARVAAVGRVRCAQLARPAARAAGEPVHLAERRVGERRAEAAARRRHCAALGNPACRDRGRRAKPREA